MDEFKFDAEKPFVIIDNEEQAYLFNSTKIYGMMSCDNNTGLSIYLGNENYYFDFNKNRDKLFKLSSCVGKCIANNILNSNEQLLSNKTVTIEDIKIPINRIIDITINKNIHEVTINTFMGEKNNIKGIICYTFLNEEDMIQWKDSFEENFCNYEITDNSPSEEVIHHIKDASKINFDISGIFKDKK